MNGARVLLMLDTSTGWSRGVVRGFSSAAHERGWTVLRYDANADFDWLLREWPADAAVMGPGWSGPWPQALAACASVSVNTDRSAEQVASVCVDEDAIADEALSHLSARGLPNVAVFRFDASPFAVRRQDRFEARARALGLNVLPGWWQEGAVPARSQEEPKDLLRWVKELNKPCGVFTCCDTWSRVVVRYASVAGIRVPEDLAIIGVDDDAMECETSAPPLSSVAVAWDAMGQHAARLIQVALNGVPISSQRVILSPVHVVVRRSTDTFAVDDALVARAVAWIHRHADSKLYVPTVAAALGTTRQKLERRFRTVLGRTIMHEVRRAHVERAKTLLATTALPLAEVALQSGFSRASMFSVTFAKEAGMPPGVYRRKALGEIEVSGV